MTDDYKEMEAEALQQFKVYIRHHTPVFSEIVARDNVELVRYCSDMECENCAIEQECKDKTQMHVRIWGAHGCLTPEQFEKLQHEHPEYFI